MKTLSIAAFLLIWMGAVAGCASVDLDPETARLMESGRYEEGLARIEESARRAPDNVALRTQVVRQREIVFFRLLDQAEAARTAGQLDRAERYYNGALKIDPANPRALAAMANLEAAKRNSERIKEAEALLKKNDYAAAGVIARGILREDPYNREAQLLSRRIEEQTPSATALPVLSSSIKAPVNVSFRDASMRQVFDVLSQAAGINFVFDKDVRPDLKTTIQVRNAAIEDVIRYILVTNQLQQKVLDETTILVYPNTPAKAKEYQDLVFKSFYLANADAKVTGNYIKTAAKPKDMFVDERLNMISVRDTPETVRIIERLIAGHDLADAEVMIDVEVLEVSRDLLQEIGIKYPGSASVSLTGAAGGGQLTLNELRNLNSNSVLFGLPNPLASLSLAATDGRANILANPRIRVRNREKARIHVGDKVPVVTTTATATGLLSQSVNYLDVGLKLEVEPNVHLVDEVAIKVGLEVSNIVSEIPGQGGSIFYRLGTRNTGTVLRLKDGETQVLAGLISDTERKSIVKVPGLGDIPGIGRLFANHADNLSKTEIVLLMTPRIIRSLARPGMQDEEFYSGTEANFGAPPLRLQRAKVEGKPGSSPGAAAAPAAKAPVALTGMALVAPASGKVNTDLVARVELATSGVVRNALVDLVFDPGRFEVVGVEPGEIIKQVGDAASLKHSAPEGQGRVSINVTSSTDLPGRGEMARVVFRVKGAPGSSAIRFEGISLQDKAGNTIPVNLPPPHNLAVVQ